MHAGGWARFSQTDFQSICNTKAFHLAEPKGNRTAADEADGGFLENITYPYFSRKRPSSLRQLPGYHLAHVRTLRLARPHIVAGSRDGNP